MALDRRTTLLLEIKGADKVLETFGLFPVFHDAEVLSVTLDRDSLSASLLLVVPKFVDGTYIGDFEVAFKFYDLWKFRLESFNHQNVVSSLTFHPVVEMTDYSNESLPRISVDLDTVFGMWSTFTCSRIEIESVVPSVRPTGNPPYSKRNR